MTNFVFWKSFQSTSDFSCFLAIRKQAVHFSGVCVACTAPSMGQGAGGVGRRLFQGRCNIPAARGQSAVWGDGCKFILAAFEPSYRLRMKLLNAFISLAHLLSYPMELITKLHLVQKNCVFQLYYRDTIACVIWIGCNKNYIQVWKHFLRARFEVIFHVLATSKIIINAFTVLSTLDLKVLRRGGQIHLFLQL